jgi:hypothetical protein
MFVRKPLYYMAEGGDGGAGAGEGGSGDGAASSGSAGGNAGAGDQGGKSDDGKTFTQADVERIIAGRLSKYADYDDVKKQLTDIQKANETETEKAINAAKEEARKAALSEATPRLVRAEFKAASVGRMTTEQLGELLEDLDLSKYVTDKGEVDVERITKKIDALAPEKEERKAAPTFGGGPRKTADKAEVAPGRARLRHAYENAKK